MSEKLQSHFEAGFELPVDNLAYTGDVVFNGDGIAHFVLDLDNFDVSEAVSARKKSTTLVLRAEDGQHTAQVFPSGNETQWEYTTVDGDAIFVQGDIEACKKYIVTGEIPEDAKGNLDIYVPDNAKHSADGRLKYDQLQAEGYEIQSGTENFFGTEAKVYSPKALMLFPPHTNTKPVCIVKDGKQSKFFPPNAAFKIADDGTISGINPDAIDTWEVMPGASPAPAHNEQEPETP